MNGLLCVTAIAAFLVAHNLAIDCSNNRCTTRGLTHIMCKYPNRTPAPNCGPVDFIGFTHAEKMKIVHKHNALRFFVAAGKEKRGNPGPQPAALYMKTMAWDNELAQIAQRWVNQCRSVNDECRDVDRFEVSQNLGLLTGSTKENSSPEVVILLWYNYVTNMNRSLVQQVTGEQLKTSSYYTRMVWHNNSAVGCGKIVFLSNGTYNYLMACNYGPAGNIVGASVYFTRY